MPQGAGAASLAPAYREPSIVSSIKGNNLRITYIGSDSDRAHVRDADKPSSGLFRATDHQRKVTARASIVPNLPEAAF